MTRAIFAIGAPVRGPLDPPVSPAHVAELRAEIVALEKRNIAAE